jgi:ATP-dependent protease ClpP protease subunit
MPKKPWFNFISKAPDCCSMMMYGQIGKDKEGKGVSAAEFLQELSAISPSKISVRMHSPGGNVFEGMMIYDGLASSGAQIDFQVDGVAASIASTICMAGTVTMAKSAMMMVHQPYSCSGGNVDELKSTMSALDQVSHNMVTAYCAKTGLSQGDVLSMMKAETWMNADKCKALGFCDCIGTKGAINAAIDFSGFSNVPEEVRAMFAAQNLPTNERDLEAVLRDAGISKKDALMAVSMLKAEARRDSELAEGEKLKQYMQIMQFKAVLTT